MRHMHVFAIYMHVNESLVNF